MIKKVIISLFFIIVMYLAYNYISSFIISSSTSYLYTEEEQKKLWQEVNKGNKKAMNKLILYYRLHDFKNNIRKVAQLRKKSLDKRDSLSCYVYGAFMVRNFDKNSSEYKEGIKWLNISKNMGNKEASSILLQYETFPRDETPVSSRL